MVNDVSGGAADPEHARASSPTPDAAYVAMHMRGTPRTMQDEAALRRRRRRGGRRAARAGRRARSTPGIDARALLADPGHRLRQDRRAQRRAACARCPSSRRASACRCSSARRASRSSARMSPSADDRPSRDDATLATTVWCFEHGAALVRVHDVAGVAARGRAARRRWTERLPKGWRRDVPAGMRGRWAQGLQPRYFTWVIKDRLGAGERPGRLRPQPPQGAPPGRADLAQRQRLHARRLVARLAAQPARVRRSGRRLRARPARPARRARAAARRRSTRTLTKLLDDPDEKLYVHNEEFGDRVLGVLAGYLLYARPRRARPARDLGRREAHRRAASAPPAARSSPSPSTTCCSPLTTSRRATTRTMRTVSVAPARLPGRRGHDRDEVALARERRSRARP